MHVLIVDDSGSMRISLEALLHLYGHTCILAQDYSDAFQCLHDLDIDACLSDMSFPRHPGSPESDCGIEVATDCMALGIPVALMSGQFIDYGQYPEVAHLKFLLKPFRAKELVRVLERLRCQEVAV